VVQSSDTRVLFAVNVGGGAAHARYAMARARGHHMSFVLHRQLVHTPPLAVSGEGCWLVDRDGRRVLDASGGAAVSSLGHGHPGVVAAIARQAAQLEYAHTSFFTNAPAEELAERLVRRAPEGFVPGRLSDCARLHGSPRLRHRRAIGGTDSRVGARGLARPGAVPSIL